MQFRDQIERDVGLAAVSIDLVATGDSTNHGPDRLRRDTHPRMAAASTKTRPKWPLFMHSLTVVNMARRTGAPARTKALAKATEAVARRDAERIAREKHLQATLADFYHAQGEIERIQNEAEIAAAPFEASIQVAVRALDSLGETRAGIAGLTGLSLPRVREYLAETLTTLSATTVPETGAPADRVLRANGEMAADTAPPETTASER
jgi:hypothetical protein